MCKAYVVILTLRLAHRFSWAVWWKKQGFGWRLILSQTQMCTLTNLCDNAQVKKVGLRNEARVAIAVRNKLSSACGKAACRQNKKWLNLEVKATNRYAAWATQRVWCTILLSLVAIRKRSSCCKMCVLGSINAYWNKHSPPSTFYRIALTVAGSLVSQPQAFFMHGQHITGKLLHSS